MKLEQLNETLSQLYLGIYFVTDRYDVNDGEYTINGVEALYGICNSNGKILEGLRDYTSGGKIWLEAELNRMKPTIKFEWDRISSMSSDQATNVILHHLKKIMKSSRNVPVYDKRTGKGSVANVSSYHWPYELSEGLNVNMSKLFWLLKADIAGLNYQSNHVQESVTTTAATLEFFMEVVPDDDIIYYPYLFVCLNNKGIRSRVVSASDYTHDIYDATDAKPFMTIPFDRFVKLTPDQRSNMLIHLLKRAEEQGRLPAILHGVGPITIRMHSLAEPLSVKWSLYNKTTGTARFSGTIEYLDAWNNNTQNRRSNRSTES